MAAPFVQSATTYWPLILIQKYPLNFPIGFIYYIYDFIFTIYVRFYDFHTHSFAICVNFYVNSFGTFVQIPLQFNYLFFFYSYRYNLTIC